MKKKVIRLTEKDIESLVEKVVKGSSKSLTETVNPMEPNNFMSWVDTLDYMESDSIRRNFNMYRVKGGEYYNDLTDETLVDYFKSLGTSVSNEDKDSLKNKVVDLYQRRIPKLKEGLPRRERERQDTNFTK